MTLMDTPESIMMRSLNWDPSLAALFRSLPKLHLFIHLFLLFSAFIELPTIHSSPTGLDTQYRQGLHR